MDGRWRRWGSAGVERRKRQKNENELVTPLARRPSRPWLVVRHALGSSSVTPSARRPSRPRLVVRRPSPFFHRHHHSQRLRLSQFVSILPLSAPDTPSTGCSRACSPSPRRAWRARAATTPWGACSWRSRSRRGRRSRGDLALAAAATAMRSPCSPLPLLLPLPLPHFARGCAWSGP